MFAWIHEFRSNSTLKQEIQYICLRFASQFVVLLQCLCFEKLSELAHFHEEGNFLFRYCQSIPWGWSGQNYQILLARSRRNSMSPYFVKHWRSEQVYFKSEINSNKELITHRNWLSYFHQRGENRNTDWEELVTEFEKLTLQGIRNSPQIQYSECISICSSRFTHRKSIFSFSRVRSRSCISHLESKRHFKPSLFSALSTFSGCQPSSTLNK